MSNNKKLLVVSKNGKLALSKIDGSLLTDFEYDNFDRSLSSYIIATKNEKQGLLNSEGRIVVPCLYEGIRYAIFHNQRMSVKRNGKYGFVDEKGEEVIPCIYDYVYDFCDTIDVTVVISDHLGAIINKEGMLVTPFKYKNCHGFQNGIPLAIAEIDGVMGCIDTRGKEAIPFVYSEMNQYSKVYINVCISGKWGCIDKKGRIVIPCLYDKWIYFRDEGVAEVKKDNEVLVINKSNHVFRNIVGFYKNWEDSYNDYLTYFQEGLGKVCEGGKYGFVNLDGEMVIPYLYDSAGTFSNGLVKVKKADLWGFIDMTGRTISDFVYYDAEDFKYGHAVVIIQRYNEKGEYLLKGVINNNGKEIIPCQYSDIILCPNYIIVKSQSKYGAFNYSGIQIAQCVYDNYLHSLNDNYLVVCYNKKKGLIDLTGGIILPYEYEEIRSESSGLFIVKKDGKYGVVDIENNMIIPFIYASIMFVMPNLFRVSENKQDYFLVNNDNEDAIEYSFRGYIEFKDSGVSYITNYYG